MDFPKEPMENIQILQWKKKIRDKETHSTTQKHKEKCLCT